MIILAVLLACSGEPADTGKAPDPTVPPEPTVDTTTSTDGVDVTDTSDSEPDEVELAWAEADNGFEWSCGLLTDGTPRCWGVDFCTDHAPAETEVLSGLSVGTDAACAIRDDGTVGCWCCDREIGGYSIGICKDVPPGEFTRVEVGSTMACAQDAAGALTCWGLGAKAFGRWGDMPVGPVTDFAFEDTMAAAVLPDGTIQAWGVAENVWDESPPAGVQFAQVEVGRTHACGLDVTGAAWCWGHDGSDVPYPDPPAGNFTEIESYQGNACVIDGAGIAACWWPADPIEHWRTPLPSVPFAQVGLGEFNGCGVDLSGQAWCFGKHPLTEPWMQVPPIRP